MSNTDKLPESNTGKETVSPLFLADDHLAKLARWLRILGFDTLYFERIENSDLVRKAVEEKRIILTRDTDIAKDPGGARCIFIRSDNWIEQIRQIVSDLQLTVSRDNLFSRCLLCNTLLQPIAKADVKERVPPFVFQTHEDFVLCPSCDKMYWQGTHTSRVLEKLKPIFHSG